MAKIIIIGAGIGGLAFAYKYQGTDEICLFEQAARNKLGFPWCDSVKAEAFKDTEIPLPGKGVYKKKYIHMYSPSCTVNIPQRKKTVKKGYEIDRVALLDHLFELVKDKVTFCFESKVTGLAKSNGKVTGVYVGGALYEADLVIDASGAFSKLRYFVCEDSADFEPNADEILYCERTLYKADENIVKDHLDAVYIKHKGGTALSWCRSTPDLEQMDVFVSSIGAPLTPSYVQAEEEDMFDRNAALSKTVIQKRCERLALRSPLSQFVYDSFAFVGDSAYMTNPVNGCGIENAMRAGAILADVLNKKHDFSLENLWNYQVKFMYSVGSNLVALDVFKRWVYNVVPEDIDWLFDTMIGAEIVAFFSGSSKKPLNPKVLLDKILIAHERKDLAPQVFKVVSRAAQAKTYALLIPAKYESKLVDLWKTRYNDFLRKGE